jgi:hypothetical protein
MRTKFIIGAFTLLSLACAGGREVSSFSNDVNDVCINDVVQRSPGSWLLKQPEVHFDFWGKYWSQQKQDSGTGASEMDDYEFDWTQLLQGAVLERLSEYGIHQGSLDPEYYANDPSANVRADGGYDEARAPQISDSSIPTELNLEISLGILPYPNDNTLYVVMLPPGVTDDTLVNDSANGYHDSSSYGDQRYAFAVILYLGPEADNGVISHELYEAATDPKVGDGFLNVDGDEIADLCEGHGTQSQVSVDGITVQKVWSQATCVCQ